MLKKVRLTNIQNRQKADVVVDTVSDERALVGAGQMANELAEITSISGVDEMIQRLTMGGPSMSDRVGFFNGLAKCFERNIPTIKAFQLQVNRVKSPRYRGAIADICGDLKSGDRISDAMAKNPDIFSPDMIALIRAGEEAGQLPVVLRRVGNSQKKALTIMRKLQAGMIYPAIVLVIGLAVVITMSFTLIPAMVKLYSSLGSKLPFATTMLMKLSDTLVKYPWTALLPFAALFYLFKKWGKIMAVPSVQKFMIALPVLGDIIRKSAAATSFRCLALLVDANVRIKTALEITADSSKHIFYKEFFSRVNSHLSVGRTMAESFLLESHWLGQDGRTICGVMELAGETGSGAEPLNEIADDYEEELDLMAGQIDKLIEPVTIVVLGTLVAFLIYAIYSPIFSLGDALLTKK
ncbi:MAG: type IV pilus assembly protein PilC [Verrucomicrobia bacterium]|nr:MAG: type IV pilus assembly protein PilC [Verrucomicrobiota bacterium]